MNKNLIGVVMFAVLALCGYVYWNTYSHSTNTPHELNAVHNELNGEQKKEALNSMINHSMLNVAYTNDGFVENELTINAGDMVTFTNQSGRELRIGFGEHEDHTASPDGKERPDLKTGMSDTIIFPEQGTFEYHNHHVDEDTGSIIVN